MKNNKIYIKYGILAIIVITIIIVIVITPLIIDYFIIGNNLPSNINNSERVSFLGSYIGALIGSASTLIGIVITIIFTINQAKEEREFTMQQNNEERRLAMAPHLKYTMHGDVLLTDDEEIPINKYKETLVNTKKDIYVSMYIGECIKERTNNFINTRLTLKNIGNGPALDMTIDNIYCGNKTKKAISCGSDGSLESGSEFIMLINLGMSLEEINSDNLIKVKSGDYFPVKNLMEKKTLFMNVEYKDLIGNKYEQTLEFDISIPTEKESDSDIWKYGHPEIHLMKRGDSKIVK